MRHPKPDAKEYIDILMGYSESSRVPLTEYLVDEAVVRPVVTAMLEREWCEEGIDRESQRVYWDNVIEFWLRMGYDFVRVERPLAFDVRSLLAPDTAAGSDQQRAWADEHQGCIDSWEDFESYPWPTVEAMDFFPFEYLNSHLPEGMGLIVSHEKGVLETLTDLMSYEKLCYALYDNPELVGEISDRLGTLMVQFYDHLMDLDNIVAVWPGDDMGFRTGTLMSPQHLRQYILPWHKRFASMAQEHGLPYFLHTCGNVETIVEDLILDVGIDGKHSFEDAITPIWEFQAKYGDRIAVLGGLDVDVLASSSPEGVRAKARFLVETCGSRGRFALGSGSSIANYIPVENYLAMIDEGLRAGGG